MMADSILVFPLRTLFQTWPVTTRDISAGFGGLVLKNAEKQDWSGERERDEDGQR